ncbi:MAG TPA: GntG family PLP-dependent aldolase [Acidimicrobiales bacterium]|nr:GntG family PLP-dependent aldolase [Acidimicrobiales bacterium]
MSPSAAPAGADGLVDLRSDTVTRPTPEMRRAMADAEVGDDGYGDDPTVNALEEAYAARVGKDAALYVPSGTMANQVALRTLCRPGDLVVAGRRQHVVIYEAGGAAANAGVQLHPVDDADGTLAVTDVAWAIEAASHHHPRPGLVCVENTHMPAGGVPWTLAALEAVVSACAGLPVHMDGARLFNAEVATGVDAARLAAPVTTVMSCLSKGLCAPVGSLLAGPADVIEAARTERQRLGGGMRQAGVIAAAGLVALRTMVARLADDHARAQRLAHAVAERWPDCGCDPAHVQTNIVAFAHRAPERVVEHLRREGVLAGTIGPGVVRLVTHHDVDDAGLERALKALADAP